jgi:ribonuclease T2
MKNPSFWLSLCLAAGPAASAATWDNGAPRAEEFAQLAPAPAPAPSGHVAGQFQSYALALEWVPTFCEGKEGMSECSTQNPDRFDATHLALHGLWPNQNGDARHDYGYCGVDSAAQALDRPETWRRLPLPALSPATRAALTTVMPGVSSFLEHHEWTRHGTCSGLDADDYFTRAAALVQEIAKSDFGLYLAAPHPGNIIDKSKAAAAFETSYGAGSGAKLVFVCAKVRGAPALSDVILNLSNPLRPAPELASMLLPADGGGNCPPTFLLDPVPSR